MSEVEADKPEVPHCPRCLGNGWYYIVARVGEEERKVSKENCEPCWGKGTAPDPNCSNCRGAGQKTNYDGDYWSCKCMDRGTPAKPTGPYCVACAEDGWHPPYPYPHVCGRK